MQNAGTAALQVVEQQRVVAIAPTYNEAANLPTLAEKLLALDPSIDVLIVDDASPDGTGELAEAIREHDPRLNVIHRTGPRGYSASCVDGLSWALENGYDIAVTMDADLSHDPDVIPSMLRAAEAGADVVVGSRYVPGGGLVVEWGPTRTAVSKLGSAYARRMIGTKVRDCTSGFRCYKRAVLEKVPLREMRSDGYSFCIEMLANVTKAGAHVEEVPITYVDRRAGVSKISRSIVVEALLRSTGIGLARMLGR
jgi:glycosyltransferase involved in cell wall biosynthesis